MAEIQTLRKDNLAEGLSSSGIARHVAFSGDGYMVVRSWVAPGTASGWHHHGDYDVYGYMVSGTARFEYGPAGKGATTVGPGDFFHVPARAVHRDVNPSPDEGQEGSFSSEEAAQWW